MQNKRLKKINHLNLKNTLLENTRKLAIRGMFIKAICSLLIINLLVLSTPAAPAALIGTAKEVSQDIRFGFLSGKWVLDFPAVFGLFIKGKRAGSLNPGLSRIQIYPGSVTVKEGTPVVFSAVGYDSQNEPLSGLTFNWQMSDSENRFSPRQFQGGVFEAIMPGTFAVKAESLGQQAEVTVVVTPAESVESVQSASQNSTSIKYSSRSGKTSGQTKSGESGGKETSKESLSITSPDNANLLPGEGGWNDGNSSSSTDPGNLPGNPPGHAADDGAGSGNFQLSAPVLSLPGRGVNLALNLNYNSRLWNKSGSQLTYDIDRGFPGPGWTLGFGKIAYMGHDSGCMVVDADGTRHGYTGYPTSNSAGAKFRGHTTDGSFIDYDCEVNYGQSSKATAQLPNGTKITYSAIGPDNAHIYPTRIRDAHGNYISITYRNNVGPAIETITDTLGRVITFNYDSAGRLISVKAPRMLNQGGFYGNSRTRTLVQFHYRQLQLGYSFASGNTAVVRDANPWVLDSIYYPATQTGYWFGDADSYSSYGMLTKVVEQRGMSWQSSAEEQGTVVAGQMTKQAVYNYPLTTANVTGRTSGVNLTDAPTYETLTESWDGMDDTPAVTTYSINNNDYHHDGTSNSPARTITITQPNGAISKQYSYRTPGTWTDGLVFADETIVVKNSTPVVVSSSLVSWQPGEYDSPRPSWSEVTDENGHKIKTVNDYTGGKFNQLARACDYDNGNNKLRCAFNDYENNSSYIGQTDSNGYYSGRHIFNLVKATGIENPDGTRASLTEYEYDGGQPLSDTSGVIQYDQAHNPYTTTTRLVRGQCLDPANISGGLSEENPCTEYEWTEVSIYESSTAARGNVTKVKHYTDARTPSGEIVETRNYDIAGNMTTASGSCCQQISFQYTIGTQYAYPESQTSGASDVNSPDRITSAATYNYETGLVRQTTNADGRNSITYYHPDTLRPTTFYSSTGSYTSYSYDDAAMTITQEVKEANGASAGKIVKYLNGMGDVRREEALGANNVWDITETKYNKLGQVWKQSRPYRSGDAVQWSETFYDEQSRTVKISEPDGSVSQVFYNESQRPDSATVASGSMLPPGDRIRVADAWGRERWARYDQHGRLVEVVEPNPNAAANPTGSVLAAGSLVTKYSYDTLDRLVKTAQGDQTREFKYDSLGRLTRQKLAEQTATLNDAGQYVGAGNQAALWSDAFWYDNRSNATMKIDARGVKTHFSYQINGTVDDPLNRLQSVTYDLSGPLDPNLSIYAASTVSYEYMTAGDKNKIKKIRTAGILTEEFDYDTEGRLKDYTQTVDGRANYPMAVSYLYDTLNRVKEVRYPAQYGLVGSPRKIVEHSYDTASRLSTLKVDSQEVAGNIVYNASDQTTSIKVGAAGTHQVTENYTFDAQTGLLTNQKALKNGQTLLDLSYEYNRNNNAGTGNGKTGHLSKIIDNLDNNKNREYEYDALGRLTKAKGGNGGNLWQQQYGYDRYGNKTSVTASGVAADNSPIPRDGLANLSYNTANNRITTQGFEYDSAGNQTRALAQDGSTWLRFEYDAANRIQIVKRDDGTALQAFQYGSANARLMDYDYGSGQLKIFASSGGTMLSEYTEFVSQQMTWTKSYTYLSDSQLSTITPNGAGGETTEYNHPDRLGTRTITNQAAGTSREQTTLPFGTALNAESTGTNNPNRFTSYDRSAQTGLDYAINRTYDSRQGRFTQVDPIKMSAVSLGSPQTLNLYTYCGNDPINHVDPSGLFFGKLFNWLKKSFKWIAIAVTVAVMVLSIFVAPGSQGILAQILGVLAKINSFVGAAIISTEGAISVGIGAYISAALIAVGAVANKIAQTQDNKKKKRRGETTKKTKELKGSIEGNGKFLPLTAEYLLDLIRDNNMAREAGADDAAILCQAWKESTFRPNAQTGSKRGLLQVGPTAAGEAGLGNGKPGKNANPDYHNNIHDPASNIRTGTTYLSIRIKRAGGDVAKGMDGYGTGKGYSDDILKCAESVRAGDIQGGLNGIHK